MHSRICEKTQPLSEYRVLKHRNSCSHCCACRIRSNGLESDTYHRGKSKETNGKILEIMNLCVAYPELTSADASLIREFRKLHDMSYVDVIGAHWTMIFPGSTEGIDEPRLRDHISSVATESSQIRFSCRYALVYDDDSNDDYYIFLVPDEGFSEISRLHDRLYSDFLRPNLRLDIPYVPHIGIATGKDPDHLYDLAREWNAADHEIHGMIDSLTLCSYDGRNVQDLETFPLSKPGEKDEA